MTTFRELREQARTRCTLVARLIGKRLRDPDLKVTVRRNGFQPNQSTVTMSIRFQVDCIVADEASDAAVREIAVIAYGQLGSYVRKHFLQHVDPRGIE